MGVPYAEGLFEIIARGVCNIVLAQFLCDFTLSTYVTSRTVNMIFFSETTT